MSNELSPEAKSLIQSYMFKLCIPSGIALTIVSAIAGFLLNEVARSKAYTDAYTKAYSDVAKSVVDTASAAAVARKDADINAQAAAASSRAAASRAAEAEASAAQIGTLFSAADARVKQVIEQTRLDVESVAKQRDFVQAVVDRMPKSPIIAMGAVVRAQSGNSPVVQQVIGNLTFEQVSGTIYRARFPADAPAGAYTVAGARYCYDRVLVLEAGPDHFAIDAAYTGTGGCPRPSQDQPSQVFWYVVFAPFKSL